MGRRSIILPLIVALMFGSLLASHAVAAPEFINAPTAATYASHGYPWEHNTIGLTDAIPSPWTELIYSGNKVSCWGREYDLSSGPVPRQITSQGRPLFAVAPDLDLMVDGVSVWGGMPPVPEFTSRGKGRAEYVVSRSAPSFDLKVVGELEYDGFLKLTLTLVPKRAVTIDKLILSLPFSREVASFFSRYIRYDYNKQVMDRRDFTESYARLDAPLQMRFNPAVWVGSHDVGMEWACETNAYWSPADADRAIRLTPASSGVVMEVRMVDRPLRITSPVSYSFALYPTPVKPVPADWRGIMLVNGWSKPDAVSSKTHKLYGWGMPGRFSVRYPGLPSQVPSSAVAGRGGSSDPGRDIREGRERMASLGIRYIPYGALYGMPALLPGNEWRDYGGEWRTMAPRGEVANPLWGRMQGLRDGEPSLIVVCPWARSYQDFLVWQYARAIEQDHIGGMYLDLASQNVMCRNTNHPHGGEFASRGGEYYPFFAQRELMRRFYVAFKSNDPDFLIIQHHAKIPVVCSGFSDAVLSGEALNLFFGLGGRGQTRVASSDYVPDYSRLPDLYYEIQYAHHRGFVDILLPQIVKKNEADMEENPAEFRRYTRILLARCALYDIPVAAMRLDKKTYEEYLHVQQRFGWLSDAEYLGPWESERFLSKGGDRFKCALYMKVKERKAFLVVANLGAEEASGEIALNSADLASRGLQLPGEGKAVDGVTGTVLTRTGGSIRVSIPANDMRVLFFQ